MGRYIEILVDCPCSTSILDLDCGATMVKHIIDRMSKIEKDVVAYYYGLHDKSAEKNIKKIAEKISNSTGSVTTDADVVQALADARNKLQQEFNDFDGKDESIKIEWIPFRKKTEQALVKHGLSCVRDIIALEQKAPLQSIKGIGVKEAIEIYEMLSPWYILSSYFEHFQETAEEWRKQYDPYVALLKAMYGEPEKDEYIVPDFVRCNINKAIEDMAKANTSNLGLAIRKYFGLGSEYPMTYELDPRYPMTCEQLGAYLLVGRGRAQQIVQTAIHRLRHPMFSKNFEFVTYSREKLLKNYFRIFEAEERARASFIEAQEALTKERLLAWGRNTCPIDELELDVRRYNGLRRDGIETISDLAQRGHEGLLLSKRIKAKDLQVIEETLKNIYPGEHPFWKEYYGE